MLSFHPPEQAATRKRISRITVWILKLGLTALILWSIFHKMDFQQVLSSFVSQPAWLLLLLLLLSTLRHAGQFLTWGYALQINPNHRVNWREVLNSYMISQPLRFVIPGGFGMTGKVLYITNSSVWSTGLSYVIERAMIIWGIWAAASVAGAFYYTRIQLWARLLIVAAVLFGPVWGYFILGLKEKWHHLRDNYLRYAPRIVGIQFFLALVAHFQYWLLLRPVMAISYGEALMRMSLTQVSMSIPITWVGLGLRESFAIKLLSEIGFQALEAVTATLTLFIIQDVVFALIGAVFFLRAKRIADFHRHGSD